MQRLLLLAVGLACIAWCLVVMPSFWITGPARDLSFRIMNDDRFKSGTLATAFARITSRSYGLLDQSDLLRARALTAVRVAEESMQRKTSQDADHDADLAVAEVRTSLLSNPGDSFCWLLLFSIDATRNGFDLAKVKFLEASYQFGPWEGWIALRRNSLALSTMSFLGNGYQQAVVSEYAGIVDADFVEVGAFILANSGWQSRDRLLSGLTSVDLREREALNRQLSRIGIRVAIPGIELEERPWR